MKINIKILQNKKSLIKKAMLVVAVFLFIAIIWRGYSYYRTAKIVKQEVNNIKNEVSILKSAISSQDFLAFKQSLQKIEDSVRFVKKEVGDMGLLKILPQTKSEIYAVEDILQHTGVILASFQEISDIGAEMYEDLGIAGRTFEELDLSKLDSDQKGNIMVALRQATPFLEKIGTEVSGILENVDVLATSRWAKYLGPEKVEQIQKIAKQKEMVDLASSLVKYLPEAIGYPIESNYLILLQNNTELRPTGGFIGTYGLLKIKDGKLEDLFIDDVYNLDKTVKKTLFVKPPWQLERWNDTTQWFLRDANWSPDFPTTAKKTQWFYEQESGQEVEFAGTIAITPKLIADLIGVVGEITVHNITFTKENLVSMLQYRVEMEFRELGIPLDERKDVIGAMTTELQAKLAKLSKEQILDVVDIIKTNLAKKHILLYFNNPGLQELIVQQGWGGEIRMTDSDYLMVVDANIGALKTDAVMDRKIDYQVSQNSDEDLIAKVEITYTNNGKFTWHSTRYRTYTRIYTPLGSELIKAEGMMANDRTRKVGEVKVEEKFDKTVFGAFIAIEPKETKTLSFEYKLPDYIKTQFKEGNYNLLIQKQPGTLGHELSVNIDGQIWTKDLMLDRKVRVESL